MIAITCYMLTRKVVEYAWGDATISKFLIDAECNEFSKHSSMPTEKKHLQVLESSVITNEAPP